MSQFTQELLELINQLRTSPSELTSQLQDFKQEFIQNYSYKTELIKELTKVTATLLKGSLGAVEENDKLNEVAEDLLNQLHNSRGTKLYAQDQEYLDVVMNMNFDGVTVSKNYLGTESTPSKVLFNLLLNADDIEQGKHVIIDPHVKYIGIAHDTVKGIPATVIVLSDSVEPAKEKPLEEGLVDEINRARENPLAFVKSVSDNKEAVDALKKAKRLGQLVPNEMLSQAAEKRAKEYKEQGSNLSYDELVEFLEPYGSRYLNVGEYNAEGSDSSKDFVVRMLDNEETRQLIFNRKFTQVGLYHDAETSVVTVLFADNFDAKLEKKDLHVLSLRRRLHRPNFTEDEENQIKNDFKSLDIMNTGLIKPTTILLFAEKNPNFAEKNPFYYKALKTLNTEENNANGVNADEFVAAVKKVIKDYNEDFSNWKSIFALYFKEGDKKKIIDKDILVETIKKMGFRVNDEDIEELVEKMDGDLDEEKFCNIMRYIETRFIRKI